MHVFSFTCTTSQVHGRAVKTVLLARKIIIYEGLMSVLIWIYLEQPISGGLAQRFKTLCPISRKYTEFDCLKREHGLSHLVITQHDARINPSSQKRKYWKINIRVQNIVADYDSRVRLEVLRAISYNTTRRNM